MRYETCNPGQDADSIHEKGSSPSFDSGAPVGSPVGDAIGTGTVDGPGRVNGVNGHQRNISESTAVNPDYAGTTSGVPPQDVAPLSPTNQTTSQSPYQSTTQSAYDSANQYTNQAANQYRNQRGPLGAVNETGGNGHLNQF
jgi:aquaporin rerated protein, other eukaryote